MRNNKASTRKQMCDLPANDLFIKHHTIKFDILNKFPMKLKKSAYI
jgi:hypothetical protein